MKKSDLLGLQSSTYQHDDCEAELFGSSAATVSMLFDLLDPLDAESTTMLRLRLLAYLERQDDATLGQIVARLFVHNAPEALKKVVGAADGAQRASYQLRMKNINDSEAMEHLGVKLQLAVMSPQANAA